MTPSKRGMQGELEKIFGNRAALEPTHIDSPKHMTKYRYENLHPGKYLVHLM